MFCVDKGLAILRDWGGALKDDRQGEVTLIFYVPVSERCNPLNSGILGLLAAFTRMESQAQSLALPKSNLQNWLDDLASKKLPKIKYDWRLPLPLKDRIRIHISSLTSALGCTSRWPIGP